MCLFYPIHVPIFISAVATVRMATMLTSIHNAREKRIICNIRKCLGVDIYEYRTRMFATQFAIYVYNVWTPDGVLL